MAKRLICSEKPSLKFGFASSEQLGELLIDLNTGNKQNLDSLSEFSGIFKHKRLTEYVILMAKELKLDPMAGYHAIELLQRFMVKQLVDSLATSTPPGAAADPPKSLQDAVYDKLKGKFPLVVFSCVQLASKMSIQSRMIDSDAAVRFLHKVGHSVSKQALLESELTVLRGLEFRLNVPNPLTYIEILLEVLGHNDPSIHVERLHHLCHHVLRFVTLERATVYDTLLRVTVQSASPSSEQSEKFLKVTEDCMLLGVAVITAAAFISRVRKWEKVIGELSHMTGISQRSIRDFAHVIVQHIVKTK
ncbi:unnamed protein product [Ophioblennius macclurei]